MIVKGTDRSGRPRQYPRESPLPEKIIWKIWSCLIGALCVLAHGTEAESTPDRSDWPRAIGHFDIKPANSKFRIAVYSRTTANTVRSLGRKM